MTTIDPSTLPAPFLSRVRGKYGETDCSPALLPSHPGIVACDLKGSGVRVVHLEWGEFETEGSYRAVYKITL